MDLSIIIVNWNTRDLLIDCLNSIQENLGAAPALQAETFVVDNASSDGSSDLIRKDYSWVHLIENQENVGFARANNQAVKKSTGKYILFLNPDTIIRPNALSTLIDFMDKHPEAGAAGPSLLNKDGTFQISSQPAPSILRDAWMLIHLDDFWRIGSYDMETWNKITYHKVDVIKGACFMAPSKLLFQIGLMDEIFFMYSEEIDLCKRIHQAGFNIYWVPSAVVTHYGGQSTGQVNEAMVRELYLSKYKYYVKHYSRLYSFGYYIMLLIIIIPRVSLKYFAFLMPNPIRESWLSKSQMYHLLLRDLLSPRMLKSGMKYQI